MQRSSRSHALRRSRNCAAEEINLGGVMVTHIRQHRRRMIGLCSQAVHRPRIFMQLDVQRRRHSLPFFDQPMHQVSQITELRLGRKCGECGNSVNADTLFTDALKINFDH